MGWGMLDALVGKDALSRAEKALAESEVKRRAATRALLKELNVADPVVEQTLDRIMAVTSQGPGLRAIAEALGNPVVSGVVQKIADRLESKSA